MARMSIVLFSSPNYFWLTHLLSLALFKDGFLGLFEDCWDSFSRAVPTSLSALCMEGKDRIRKPDSPQVTWKSICSVFVALTIAFTSAAANMGLPPWLEEDQIRDEVVTVRVYKDDRLAAEGAGVVIGSDGYVLTSAAVLDAGPRVAVVAGDVGELAAVVRLNEKSLGLGILQAEGLSGGGLPLSAEPPTIGSRIFSMLPVLPETTDGSAPIIAGAIGEAEIRSVHEGEIRLYRHNAMITARWYGSPAIDECGRIVALNIPDPGIFSLFTVPRKREPKGVVFALSAGDMASHLEALNIQVTQEVGACISADMRAQQRAREAEQAAGKG